MTQHNHIMLDLETMGSRSNAAMIAIAKAHNLELL